MHPKRDKDVLIAAAKKSNMCDGIKVGGTITLQQNEVGTSSKSEQSVILSSVLCMIENGLGDFQCIFNLRNSSKGIYFCSFFFFFKKF